MPTIITIQEPITTLALRTLQTYVQAYIHGSDVVLIGFSDFLHDLHLSLTTAIDTSFDSDGSLLVVQWQVLKAAHTSKKSFKGGNWPFSKRERRFVIPLT